MEMLVSLLGLTEWQWPVPVMSTMRHVQKLPEMPCRHCHAQRLVRLRVRRTTTQHRSDSTCRDGTCGVRDRRHWCKLHLAIQTATAD